MFPRSHYVTVLFADGGYRPALMTRCAHDCAQVVEQRPVEGDRLLAELDAVRWADHLHVPYLPPVLLKAKQSM